MTINERKRQQ
jgi:hypothetical protein